MSLGRVCLLKPTQCQVEEPSKYHSSSAATPLPQPSKEQHGVISALRDAQKHCPEQETPHNHLPRHDTQGNPGESPPCRAGLPLAPSTSPTSSPGPVTAARDGFPGGTSLPHQATALMAPGTCQPSHSLAARTSPSSCCDGSPRSPPPTTLETQSGADRPPVPACPERARGVRARP